MGYLPKSVGPRELLQAIRCLSRGNTYLHPSIATRIAERDRRPKLTARELQVIELLAKGRSNKGIAFELNISPRTAKLHVGNILRKMDAMDRTQAVTTALQRGLIRLE